MTEPRTDDLTGRIPTQRPPPPDPWQEAMEQGVRAFAAGTGEPATRAAAAIAAALFVYAQRTASLYRHRLLLEIGKDVHMWAAARCACGGLNSAKRRGQTLDKQVMADFDRHLRETDEERR